MADRKYDDDYDKEGDLLTEAVGAARWRRRLSGRTSMSGPRGQMSRRSRAPRTRPAAPP
jgi:hypothetical protein